MEFIYVLNSILLIENQYQKRVLNTPFLNQDSIVIVRCFVYIIYFDETIKSFNVLFPHHEATTIHFKDSKVATDTCCEYQGFPIF